MLYNELELSQENIPYDVSAIELEKETKNWIRKRGNWIKSKF